MLDEAGYEQWCIDNKITDATRKIIDEIRSSQPSRRVKSTPTSMSGRYPSRKMMLVIQFESHTLEYPVILVLEYDAEVLEYYDQPPPFKISYSDKKGRKRAFFYTADFFVLWKTGAGWIECKPDEELVKLSVESPNRYMRDPQGSWICSPGEEYARRYGMTFTVFPSSRLESNYCRNLVFMEDYYRDRRQDSQQ